MKELSEEEFSVGIRRQTHWGGTTMLSFLLGNVGAGLFLVSLFIDLGFGLALGWLMVAIGKNLIHLLELGRPERFLKTFSNLRTSWISRGLLSTVLFVLFAGVYTGLFVLYPTWTASWSNTALGYVFKAVTAAFSMLVMTYTGFLMSYSPAIPLWNSALLPVMSFSYSALSGTGLIFLALQIIEGRYWWAHSITILNAAFIALTLALITVYVLGKYYSRGIAADSARAMTRERGFRVGVIAIGSAVPLVVGAYLLGFGVSSSQMLLAVAGLLELIGSAAFIYSTLEAGAYASHL